MGALAVTTDTVVYGDLDAIRRSAAQVVAPPREIPTVAEMAPQFRLPDGPKEGDPYNPMTDPIHAAGVSILDSKLFRRYVIVGAVQTGKTLLWMIMPLIRSVTRGKQNVVYSQPTMPKIHEAWAGKLKPFIESSAYGEWMPKKGQGSRQSESPLFVTFRNPADGVRSGTLWFISGGGSREAGQGSVSAATVCIDEVDAFNTRHRVNLVTKRAESFKAKKKETLIFTSTVKKDAESIILAMYETSTGARLHFMCLQCRGWAPLEWENVSYDHTDDKAARETVAYNCPHCAVKWTESDRLRSLRYWRVVHSGQKIEEKGPFAPVTGDLPRSETCGFLWTALDSTLRDLGTLAVEHLEALRALENGDHGPMRNFVRDQLCKMYTGEIEEMETSGPLKWQKLAERASKETWGPARPLSDRRPESREYLYSRHVCEPHPDATWSVAGVDVQDNRVYWLLRSFNRDETSWIHAWGYEYARLDQRPADKQEMRALLRKTNLMLREYCGQTDLVLAGLDVGDGEKMEDLRQWIDSTKDAAGQTIWRACKGHKAFIQAQEADIEGICYWRNELLLIMEANARNDFHGTLRRPIDAAGATHIPHGIGMQDASLLRHLVAEQEGLDPVTKKKILIRGTGRWDWLDCAKETQALIAGFLLDLKTYEKQDTALKERQREIARVTPAVSSSVPTPDDGPQPHPMRVRSSLDMTRFQENAPFYRTPRRYGGVGSRRGGF